MPKHPGQTSAARKPWPTLRGWALFVCGVIALVAATMLGREDFLLAGFALVLAPLVAMIALIVGRPAVTVSRSFRPDVIAVDDSTTVTLTLHNAQERATPAGTWRDAMPSGVEAQESESLPALAATGYGNGRRSSATLRYRLLATQRGSYPIGPLILRRTDPFGLASCEYSLGQPKQLLVTPRVWELADAGLEITSGDGVQHELLRHTSPSADELIAREYRPGDPLRRVHWRATARHGELMVRQEEQRSSPEAWIVFDTRHAADGRHQKESADAAFESAVELVASLGVHLLGHGFTVNVLETGPAQLLGRSALGRSGALGTPAASFEQPGGDQLLLGGLAGIRYLGAPVEDYPTLLSSALHRSGRAVPVFAVLLDDSADEIGALATVRSLADPAIAFLGGSAEIEQTLVDAGWRCVSLSAADGAAEAWRVAGAGNGRMVRHG